MNRSLTRRLGTVTIALLATFGLVAASGPAQAASMSFSKSSGRQANLEWLEIGELNGAQGNVHFGYMFVEDLGRGQANVFGFVEDLQCPEGVVPEPGGGHGGEEGPLCEFVGFREISGGDVTFVMDRKFTSGRLTGTLAVSDHGGPVGNPAVDITLTGFGSLASGTDRGSFSDGTATFSYRYSYTQRQATVEGEIGQMVFDDEPGEYSFASMGTFKNAFRDRVR